VLALTASGARCFAAFGLTCLAAGDAVNLLLAGTARVVAWLAVTAVVSITAGIVYAVIVGRVAADATGDRAGNRCR
jgi:hypothetical protein